MFTIGSISIQLYSLIIGLGAAIGLLWSSLRVSALSKAAHERLNFGVFALIGALLGGRMAYVGINWAYFQHHLNEILQVWLGGISWAGSFLGSLIVVWVMANHHRRPLGIIFDGLIPLLTSLTISTWLASWLAGHAYGIPAEGWWGIPSVDEWGQMDKRWPTQVVGAISTLGIHWSVDKIRFQKWMLLPGVASSVELGFISTAIMGLSFFRGDSTLSLSNFSLDFWAALGFMILSLISGFMFLLKGEINKVPLKPTMNEQINP